MAILTRTFVSFSADKERFELMTAWTAHIDFHFADFRLD